MLNAVMDTVMAGKLQASDLAVVGIGSSIYISVNVGLMGLLMPLMPEIARHHGAGRPDLAGRDFRQGMLFAAAISIPGMALLSATDLWLSLGHPGPEVSSKLNDYLFWIMLSLPANLFVRCCFCLNMGIERPKVMMVINVASLLFKLPLNLIFMFGAGSWAGLGAEGCGVATAIVSWAGLAAHVLLLRHGKAYGALNLFGKGKLFDAGWAPDVVRRRQLLSLGLPTAGGYILEVTSFTFMALWLARMGTTVSASHQIAANFTALIYMIGLAISNASSNLTARELGAGRLGEARSFALHGVMLTAACALGIGLLVASGTRFIAGVYTEQADIVAAATPLLMVVALYHFFDVGQTVCCFTLRAYRVVQPTVWIFFVCLWVIGLGLGYQLSFGSLPKSLIEKFGNEDMLVTLQTLRTTPLGFWCGALTGVMLANFTLFILLMKVMRRHR